METDKTKGKEKEKGPWTENANLLSKRLANSSNNSYNAVKTTLIDLSEGEMKKIEKIFRKKHHEIDEDSIKDLDALVKLSIRKGLFAPEGNEKINLKIDKVESIGLLISKAVQLKTLVTSVYFKTTPKPKPSAEDKNHLLSRYQMADNTSKIRLISVPGRIDDTGKPIGEFNNWKTKAVLAAGFELPPGVSYDEGGKFLINSQQCPLALLGAYISKKYPLSGSQSLISTLFWLTASKRKEKAMFKGDCIEEITWLAENDNPLLLPGPCLTKGRLEYAIYLALGDCRIISPYGLSLSSGIEAVRVINVLTSMVIDCEKTLNLDLKDKDVANVCLGICNIIQRFFQPRNIAILNNSRVKFDDYLINSKGDWTFDIDTKILTMTSSNKAQTDTGFSVDLMSEGAGTSGTKAAGEGSELE